MLKTGHEREKDGKTFRRQLLSEYHPGMGLERYIAYERLKDLIHIAGAASLDEIDAKASDFFAQLKESFILVKRELHEMELKASRSEADLRHASQDDLRAQSLFEIYALLHKIDRYRALNVAGFAKAMEKFFKRVGIKSLAIQDKLFKADRIISESILSVPMYATTAAKELVAATFAVTQQVTLEQSITELEQSIAADPNFTQRIVSLSEAHFFRLRSSHQQIQGTFAAKVLSGTSNPIMAKHICSVMRSSAMLDASIGRFSNGEVSIRVEEAVRADDVYIVQSMASTKAGTMSSSIMELLLALQTAQLASCARLTAVIPYLAYSKRTPEVAALAEMIELMGCQRVITVDLFAEQVEGMFSVPVDNIYARDEFVKYLLAQFRARGHPMNNLVVVSPNADNVARARSFADRLMKFGKLDPKTQFVGVASAIKREGSSDVDVAGIVAGMHCIIVDNVLDEAYAVIAVAERLRELGASKVQLIATHAVFSGDSHERVMNSTIDEVVVTDSINRDDLMKIPGLARKLRVLPVAPLLAGVIDRVHSDINAVSELLEK